MKRKVFIDGGACTGQSVKKWATITGEQFRDYTIYSFEALPKNIAKFKMSAQHPNVTLIEKAIWIKNTTAHFYVANSKFGSTLRSDKVSNFNSKADKPFIEVECVDFAEWILETTTAQDDIFLKLDIEGAEFDVLPHLFSSKVFELRNILTLFIEFHSKKLTSVEASTETALRDQLSEHGVDVQYWDATKI